MQHLHRVAAQRESAGDEQRDEAHRAGDDVADTVPVDAFQNQPENHRAPANEHRSRVEVGHRRTALKPHAENQPGRVDDCGQGDQIIGGLVRPLGQGQPAAAGHQESQHVKDFALVKRVEVVEGELLASLAEFDGEAVVLEVILILPELVVEGGGVVFGVGGDHAGVGLGCGMELNFPVALG